jgi:hypothetical protein
MPLLGSFCYINVAGIKELINNSTYSHSDVNNKPKEKLSIILQPNSNVAVIRHIL